jgi:lysylphosphatidylglycerol synthetase-like protein (DUF2156 family)
MPEAAWSGEQVALFLPLALVRQESHIAAFANVWPGRDKDELSVDLMRHRESACPASWTTSSWS